MRRSTSFLSLALLVIVALAGCIGNGDDLQGGEPRDRETEATRITDDLFGWILAPDRVPLADVRVSVIGADAQTTTNESGFYGFPKLPRQEDIILIAEHDAFLTQSKQILLPVEGSMRLNFTLEPRPEKKGHMEVLDFHGLIACQGVVEVQEAHLSSASRGLPGEKSEEESLTLDCGFMDPNNNDRWEFSVGREVAGVIIEVFWEPNTAFSDVFLVTVETTGFGADDAVLAEVKGPSGLMAQITQHQSDRFYAEGGIVRLTAKVDPNLEDEEMGLGVAFAYQQEFEVFASVFYVDSPPAAYSVGG